MYICYKDSGETHRTQTQKTARPAGPSVAMRVPPLSLSHCSACQPHTTPLFADWLPPFPRTHGSLRDPQHFLS